MACSFSVPPVTGAFGQTHAHPIKHGCHGNGPFPSIGLGDEPDEHQQQLHGDFASKGKVNNIKENAEGFIGERA